MTNAILQVRNNIKTKLTLYNNIDIVLYLSGGFNIPKRRGSKQLGRETKLHYI